MHTKIKRIILASILVGGISNAYALRLPGIPFDLPDGQTQQTDSDQNKTNDSQPVPANNNGVKNFFASKSGAVQSLNAALRDLSLSQSIFATALDLKEEASVAQANAESLAKGDLTGKDDIKKTVAMQLVDTGDGIQIIGITTKRSVNAKSHILRKIRL
jgi:hypothetical protein